MFILRLRQDLMQVCVTYSYFFEYSHFVPSNNLPYSVRQAANAWFQHPIPFSHGEAGRLQLILCLIYNNAAPP